MNPASKDDVFMREALRLADTPKDCLLPNPRVGAVIVRGGKIIGRGFHRGPGRPHAEVEAVRDSQKAGTQNFKTATIYVTLEPCCHTNKRTPPCVPLLTSLGFKKVVIAHRDPNPAVAGKGIRQLRQAGVSVSVGLLEREAVDLNQAFIKNQTTGRPYITLKLATTFDGKMADDFGISKWITSEESRKIVHDLRARADAMAVGSGTIDSDDPSLNARNSRYNSPKKVVIFGVPKKPLAKLKAAKANGLENVILIANQAYLQDGLKFLYDHERIHHLMIEGGPRLASEFLKRGLVDELFLFQGMGFLGGSGKHSIGRQWRLNHLSKSTKFAPESVKQVGPDILIQGRFHVYRPHTKSR